MGMDSYVYSFNRDDWNRMTALKKEKQELCREVDERYKIAEEKYKWSAYKACVVFLYIFRSHSSDNSVVSS